MAGPVQQVAFAVVLSGYSISMRLCRCACDAGEVHDDESACTLHKHVSCVSVYRLCIASHALRAALTMYHNVSLTFFDIDFTSVISFFMFLGVCRNILKTNDVRTGLKKPEQESKKRAPSFEAAQLADTAQNADAAATAAADREPGRSGQAATLASAEWDAASAARQRCILYFEAQGARRLDQPLTTACAHQDMCVCVCVRACVCA